MFLHFSICIPTHGIWEQSQEKTEFHIHCRYSTNSILYLNVQNISHSYFSGINKEDMKSGHLIIKTMLASKIIWLKCYSNSLLFLKSCIDFNELTSSNSSNFSPKMSYYFNKEKCCAVLVWGSSHFFSSSVQSPSIFIKINSKCWKIPPAFLKTATH